MNYRKAYQDIVDGYFTRKDSPKFAHVATIEIKENDYNPNIPRHVDILRRNLSLTSMKSMRILQIES